MSLVQAVDALLAYVDDHYRTPDYGDRLPQFNALDTAVYLEARRLGLQDADLPRKDATFYSDEVVFFGRTNVPRAWSSPPDAPSTLTMMATQGWRADMLALRALADAGVKHEERSPKRTTEQPKTSLTGWRDITAALGKLYSQRAEIKSLSERFEGPIVNKGAGTRPMVYREDLFAWWDKLAVQEQDLANRREGARLSAEAQYNYGRDGKAAPEIGGGVKKRRRDKRT